MTRRTIRTAATCSALALATALAAAPASAQVAPGSFQGTPTVTFGAANVTEGAGTTDVQVNSTSAVIDWTPDDTAISNGAPILFQPAGTTATFHNNSSTMNDFAVLNRIVPVDASRPIIFDGTVISRLQTSLGQVPGGTVFFYSPGGIIVGANAVFDVGNLGLTTSAPIVDGAGNWYNSVSTPIFGSQVQLAQAASGSFVDIQAGAQITASAENSYIAVFSPYIVQDGTISVNGQAALVAAEAGTLTFNPFSTFGTGLIDIEVTIGTDGQGGVGIEHGGTTGGPASSGTGDLHRVFMVAIPKNTLLSMLFERGSSVGFDVAGAADVQGNAVVLSAGQTLRGDAFKVASRVGGGNININDSNTGLTGAGIDFTSKVTAVATNHLTVDVFRQTNFASDAFLVADDFVQVSVGMIPGDPAAGSLTVGGSLFLDAAFGQFPGATSDAGLALLVASDGGTVDVAGGLTVRAAGVNDRDGDGVVEGGTAQINLSGGFVNVGGDVLVQTAAFNTSGPDTIGGNTQVNLFGASGLTVGGVMRLDSNGIAGGNNGTDGSGSNGTGGFSSLQVAEGSNVTTNELNITADGVGGADSGAGAGAGTGGTAQISVDGVGSTLTVQQFNQTGMFNFGELDLLSAEGFGGATYGLGGTVGGTGTGGNAGIFVTDGGSATLPDAPAPDHVRVLARGTGGQAKAAGTTGGDGFGGNLTIFLDNGTLSAGRLLPSNVGLGGSWDFAATGAINGGDGFGGNRTIHILNGSTFTGNVEGGTSGGGGGEASNLGIGGDASGGSTSFILDNSTLNVTGKFIIIGQGAAGGGLVGGNASAGNVDALITNDSEVNIPTGIEFSFSANAFGGTSRDGNGTVGGNATGGTVQVTVDNSTITGDGGFGAVAVGVAGAGGAQGGIGTGGSAVMTINNSNIAAFELAAVADGTGGALLGNANSAGGVSGNATGGTAGVNLTGSTVSANTVIVSAQGNAGDVNATGFTGLTGGNGVGGTAFFQALGGSSVVAGADLRVDASGSGGTLLAGTGTGGNGTGGLAYLRSDANLVINSLATVVGNGDGGSAQEGGTGGAGTSGAADVTVAGGGALTINGNLAIDASSAGGDGTVGGPAAFGGGVVLNADNGTLALNGPVLLTANAQGGAGTTGAGGAATAGNIFAVAQNGGSITLMAETEAFAFAAGGATVDGVGGAALGGNVTYVGRSGGTFLLDNPNATLHAQSRATGGSASGLGDGGDATAGTASVRGNGGTISIAGSLDMASDATGGNGVNGGNATGSTDSLAQANTFLHAIAGGSVDVLGVTNLTSFIAGGFGSNGGAGGNATGGTVVILAQTNTASSLASRINLHDVFAFNETVGGDGGFSATGVGGAGGDGTAGSVEVLGDAGDGQLVVDGTMTLDSVGTGGTGGDGATGGFGGIGTGGAATFGTRSGAVTADNTGSANFNGDVFANATGVGGDGGAGSSGLGGDGGDGVNGGSLILVRGSPVTLAGSTQLFAGGLGGTGGIGSSGDGVGGDGIVGGAGGIGIIASDRFNVPANRGLLTANTIGGQAFAQGGSGSATGASLIGDQTALIAFTNADANIGTLNFVVTGATVVGTLPDLITLTNATVDVTDFAFVTSSDLILALDGAVLNTDNFFLQSRALVLPGTAPTAAGTVNVSNGLQIFVDPGASIRTYTNFNTDFGVGFTVDGDFETGDFTANGDIFFESLTGAVTTGNLSGGSISLLAAQDITAGDIDANGDIVLRSQSGTVNVGALNGASLNLSSAQAVVLGNFATSGDIVIQSLNSSITTGSLAGNSVDLRATTFITTGPIVAQGGPAFARAGGAISTGSVSASAIDFAGLGTLTTGALTALAGPISLASSGNLATGTLTSSQFIMVRSNGAFASGDIVAGRYLSAQTLGGITIGNVTTGTGPAATDPLNANRIGLASQGNIATGNLQANGGYLIAVSDQSIATGAIFGRDVQLFAGTNVTTGGIRAGTINGTVFTPNGRIFIGNVADSTLGGTLDNYNPEPVFASVPTAVGGAVTIGGPSSAANFAAAAQQGFAAASITAGSILVDGGNLAAVNGLWAASDIEVRSNDIEIGSSGGIDAGSGELRLISTNFSGMFVGEGLSGSGGYRLSNAEFGRISGGGILIAGVDDQEGSSVGMTIGDLSVSGNQLGGSEGFITFAVGDVQEQSPSGTIRVDGEIVATDMGPDNYIEFFADTVEVNAETGGVFSSDASGGLGGIVLFEAEHIHVASEEILLRLREDPLYEGRANDLNQPGSIDRPDGVLRALGLEFYPGQTLYIQNTGSGTTPAGFYTTIENSEIEPSGFSDSEAPDVDVIINGRFQTDSGDVSGKDAFDLIVANAESFDGFTETSQVNGCAFGTSACTVGFVDEGTPPPVSAAEIEVLTEDQAEEEPFDTEDEEEAEDEASSPIAPPVVLINTRPLTPEIDIDDPVSGTGNPALIDSSLNEAPQGDDQ